MSEVDAYDGVAVAKREIMYRVDEQDRIVFVSPDWVAFAGGNGGSVDTKALIGTKISQHLTDPTTQQVYHLVMAKVRDTGKSITLPFRCDAPDRRRFMELEISPLFQNYLQFHTRLLLEEERAPVALLTSAGRVADGKSRTVLMCSWCKRVAAPEWLEVEAAVLRLRLFDEAAAPLITHGMCPDCRVNVEREIDAF